MIYTHDTGAPLTKEQWDFNFQQAATRYSLATGTPMSVILRQNLNRALMNREVDSNFQNLDAALMRLEYGDGPYPVLDQTFVGASFLDPRFTFSRSGKSWRIVNGVLREYGVNEPVLTPEGWSLWPAGTNLVPGNIGAAPWSSGNGVTANPVSEPAPPSSEPIQVFEVVAPSSNTWRTNSTSIAPPANPTLMTFQFFAHAGSIDQVRINTWLGLDRNTTFTLSGDGSYAITGDTSTAPKSSIEKLAGGWYLCTRTETCPAGLPRVEYQIRFSQAGSVYICGVQANDGGPIPPIPTTSAAVTRPADNASIQGAAFGEIFNPMEGAIVLDGEVIKTASATGWPDLFRVVAGGAMQFKVTRYFGSGSYLAYGPGFSDQLLGVSSDGPHKFGVSWSSGEMRFFVDGSLALTRAISPLPSAEELRFTSGDAGARRHRRLTIFTQRPSDAQMMALTA